MGLGVASIEGCSVGSGVGSGVGASVDAVGVGALGLSMGAVVGTFTELKVGCTVGCSVGSRVGSGVGGCVGLFGVNSMIDGVLGRSVGTEAVGASSRVPTVSLPGFEDGVAAIRSASSEDGNSLGACVCPPFGLSIMPNRQSLILWMP